MNDTFLFTDNCWIQTIDGGDEYLAIQITDNSIYFCRYIVPGRCDRYSFELQWEGQAGVIRYFTDFSTPILESVKQFQKDLKKKKVKELIQVAKNRSKLCRTLLDRFLVYFVISQ